MDALGNLQVGGSSSGASNTLVSYRFRAERSGALAGFRAYWLNQDYPGYGGGTGGTIRVSVEADNAGVPSGSVLASTDVVHPASDFPFVRFPSRASLSAGVLYHLVFTNIDPNPTVNFVSLDLSWVAGGSLSPRQPNVPDSDYAALEKLGTGGWHLQGAYTPILDLTYGSGAHQGQGYMEIEDTPLAISGANSMVRERITVSGGDRVVTGAAVRVARTSGTGNLVMRLEDSSGSLIDSFVVSAGSVPTLSTGGTASGVWVSGSFSAPRTLVNGATYHLRLSTDSSTSLWTRGIQQGSSYGFDPATYFADGVLQATTNGGSSWSTVPGLGDRGDLQFYLR